MTARIRETRILEHAELTTGSGKLADVLTYKTRRLGTTWAYRTAIIGRRGEEVRSWIQDWPNEEAARKGHRDYCDKIHREQGMTLQ